MAAAPGTASGRIEYLDGLRAALMLLGIPFHTAQAFSGIPWFIQSPTESPSLDAFAEFLHIWRMPAFFVVAGIFSTMILGRRAPGAWLRGRAVRLGFPLLFGMLLLNPIQWALIGWARTGDLAGALAAVETTAAAPSSRWLMHLWFLLNLLLYSAALALIAATPVRRGALRLATRVSQAFTARPHSVALALAAAAGVAVILGLAAWQASNAEALTHSLLTRNLIMFAPAFVLGGLLGMSPTTLAAALSLSTRWVAAVAALTVGAVLWIELVDQRESAAVNAVHAASWTVGGLAMTVLALKVAAARLDRPSRTITWLVDSSLVVYLVHQPLIILVGAALMSVGIVGWLGWAVTVAAVLVGSLALYEAVNALAPVRFAATGSRRRGLSYRTVAGVHGPRLRARVAATLRRR
ncbi:acyltransferase family protein [Demequina iriomotensis]|uniref:acyltransferase family protein n=1 Tax=Demequina iriomotensis TaxID=1536641 RepID=UPI0007857DB6|nr:acyltransferase family protein [Demequina iriomotensis]